MTQRQTQNSSESETKLREFRIGKFYFRERKDGNYWVSRSDGEGMLIPVKKLERVIEALWLENF